MKLELWNAVCETDPKHTKKVTFGRGFTAIDPMYQIREATRQFGAVGEGWGWEVKDITYPPNNTVCVVIRLWHGKKENFYEHVGQSSLFAGKDKPDVDCLKKAVTDGVTKALSCLGFNADVFLGKFDDNKYVKQMEEKHSGMMSADDVTPESWLEQKIMRLEEYVTKPKSTTEGLAKGDLATRKDPIFKKLNDGQTLEYEEALKLANYQLKQKEAA